MPRKAKVLSALEVGNLKSSIVQNPASPRHGEPFTTYHPAGGVAGLLLRVTPTGAKSWILRVRVGNRRRDIGLGGYPDITLSQARERAREKRAMIESGIDPVIQRRQAREALITAQERRLTFNQAAIRCHAKHEFEFKNAKHRKDWIGSLELHAFPLIGNKQVADIDVQDIIDVLNPIWKTRTETASRVRGRMESVLAWATVSKYREAGLNPARWLQNLDQILPKPRKVTPVRHFPALPYLRVGLFMDSLKTREGSGARALEFAILTAARTGEVRGATWGEIDMKNRLWTLSADRMKRQKAHKVPLSDQAITLLKAQDRSNQNVFPAFRGGMVSDATLGATIKRMNQNGDWLDPVDGRPIVPHGFRSTFKDWSRNCTQYADEASELSLAHVNSDATRAAYARDELIPMRAKLMQDWGSYAYQPLESESVTPIVSSHVL